MPHPPTPGKRCAVPGCKAWAVRDQVYCSNHLHQYEDNVRLGVPDPAPRMVGRDRRLCRARSCKRLAMPGSLYCPVHAEQFKANSTSTDTIAKEFAALMTRLDGETPDSLATLQRELDLLGSARKILVAQAEMSSRSGWKAMSSMTFIRLWLSSATTVNDLVKSRYVMETATGADFDRLLGGVYGRIERGAPPDQHPLPGMEALVAPVPTPDDAAAPAAAPGAEPDAGPQVLDAPEEQLVEWLMEARVALGVPTVTRALEGYAQEAGLPHDVASAMGALARLLPPRQSLAPLPGPPPSPAELGARLTTLAEIMAAGPNLGRAHQLLQRSIHAAH